MNYDQTVVDLFRETARKFPKKIAVNFMGREMSYYELDVLSADFAEYLVAQGIKRGDRVSLLLPNSPQFVIAYLGILKMGGVVAAMNPLVSTDEVRGIVKQADPKLLITAENFSEHNKVLYQDLYGRVPMMMVKLGDYMPGIISVLYRLKNIRQEFYSPKDSLKWRRVDYLSVSKSAQEMRRLVTPGDLAVLQFTGGTTGIPKAVMLTHRNIVSNALQALQFVNRDETIIDENSIFLGVLPFFHVYGLSVCLNIAFSLGTAVVLLPRFDAGMVCKAIKKYKVDIFPGINRMFAKLVDVANAKPSKYKKVHQSLRLCFNGAGPLDGQVKKEFEAMSGSTIIEGYGLSEASPIVSVNPVKGSKVGSLGQLVPDTEIKIVEDELWVRGPQVMSGYWRNEKESQEVLKEGGWLVTGDMCHEDKDGFLWMDDRKKDMIKIRGENVYTKEIEEVIRRHSLVDDVAVVGMPDKKLGEKIVACVVVKDGQAVNQATVQAFCKEKKLSSVKIPQEVVMVGEIPKTIIGKVLKKDLRKMLKEKA